MKERKREITVETYEVLIISRHGSLSRSWCRGCGKQVAVISLDDASMSGLSAEAIRQQIESGRLHLIERPDGLSFICLNSLVQN